MSDRPMISVVLPAYNEEALIAETLKLVCEHLESIESRYEWEVLVVDDGSRDATASIVEAFFASEPRVRLLRHVTNFNLGQALRFAFNRAKGDYVITLDSDLSYRPGAHRATRRHDCRDQGQDRDRLALYQGRSSRAARCHVGPRVLEQGH